MAKPTTDGELPSELDFFKYAQGGSAKRKTETDSQPKAKKARLEDDMDVDEEAENVGAAEEGEPSSSMPRQRVTAKGNNVPEAMESFDELRERYSIPSRLLQNLEASGYKQPTGIQAHGVPILLEVSSRRLLREAECITFKPFSTETSPPFRQQEREKLSLTFSLSSHPWAHPTLAPTLNTGMVYAL